MFKKILFPTDFSKPSLYALEKLVPQFVKMGVKNVILVYVYEGMVGDEMEADLIISRYAEKLREYSMQFRDLNTETTVKVGIASNRISETAIEYDVDLIAIPSKGENIMREMFLGSTASNLVRLSKKPVLLLKYEWDRKAGEIKTVCRCDRLFSKPLIALDFSKCSKNLMELIKKFEEYMDKAILIHVVDYGKYEEVDKLMDEAYKRLEEYSKLINREHRKMVCSGVASKNIMRIAREEECTLIIMGKKGRSHIKDLLLGSTAERIIRESKLPILLNHCKANNIERKYIA